MNRARIRAFITMMVLFGLPLGSWLYLRKGIDYRKEALAEMQAQGVHPIQLIHIRSGDSLDIPRITVVAPLDESIEQRLNDLEMLDRQYGERSEVLFALQGPEEALSSITDRPREILESLYYSAGAPIDNRYLLLDTKNQIRGSYNPESQDDMRSLVKHISILLPVEKRKTIDLIRATDHPSSDAE